MNIVASTFFGAISGSSVADTASIGSVMIPEMEKKGYPRDFAAAVTASGSVQAILTPPSHNSVIYSLATGGTVSIAALFIAGILPGLLLSLTLMVMCTVVHFYTTGHLTAVTALKALDAEFEAVSASLKVPFYKTFWRVTLPICTPALVDIARYFFINAMTTISAVVFLYSPDTKLASIAILNLDEAGDTGPAAACAVLIAAASTVATLLFMGFGRWIERRTQAWRQPAGQ